MKKVLYFKLAGCPYCANADKSIKELIAEHAEYSKVEFTRVDENEQPDLAAKYDYFAVPSMFIDNKKIYEAHKGEKFDECKANIKRVLDAAVLE